MAIREIDKAKKKFFRVLVAALTQRRVTNRRCQIGPGRETLYTIHRAAAKTKGTSYSVGFCAGKQEIARRKQKHLARCGRIGRLVLSPYQ